YYNEEWVPINDMKAKEMRDPISDLARLEKENKKKEETLLVRNKFLPIYDEVLEGLESVDMDNNKVKKMNDMQIEAEKFARDTSKDIITYYDGGDMSEQDLKQYDEEMKEKYQAVLDYRDKLIDLYNLEQTENKKGDSNFYKLKRAED